ncbi:hypothetical protein BD410DRAFT_198647 [Rickenella mellea]|uniref:Uncharacterized protein n=1 Tax=Rickenella mellea TaxID=50990 RepID=A0A4Y7Q664_9AGAM|nr:hypothetical protein BD410DRAFT_198647 [Rickenella mellea]
MHIYSSHLPSTTAFTSSSRSSIYSLVLHHQRSPDVSEYALHLQRPFTPCRFIHSCLIAIMDILASFKFTFSLLALDVSIISSVTLLASPLGHRTPSSPPRHCTLSIVRPHELHMHTPPDRQSTLLGFRFVSTLLSCIFLADLRLSFLSRFCLLGFT